MWLWDGKTTFLCFGASRIEDFGMKASVYFTYYTKMSKQFYFFKKVVQGGLEGETILTLWDLLESWASQNNWIAIFFIIFLGIIFEIILIKICTCFRKKAALPEKDNPDAHEKEDSCLKSPRLDKWSIHSSSEERIDDFSERTIPSSLTSEGNEGNFEDGGLPADETVRAGPGEGKYQVSRFSESHVTSSNGTSSSLSLFHSEVQEVFLRRRGYPESEHETIQFSSKKLFSMMKTNKNKNVMFSSDFNFSRTSRIIIESEDLDVAPFPPAHLFLSRDQVRLLEENVRNQIPLKSKASLESKATHLYSSSQESLIQNQHSVRMDIFAQAQDSFPGQSDTQYQSFSEAQFTSQAQEPVNNQESISSHADVKARYFALPQELMKQPLSSSTHASFQTKEMDRNQLPVEVSHSVETKDSIEGLDSEKKHLDEAQYSVWFEDSNEIKYLIQLENTIFKNARFLVLTLNPKSVVKGLPQLKSIRTKGQKQIASSKLKRYHAYGSVPLAPTLNRQKKRRKSLHCKSKFRLRAPPQKSKETPTSRVFQITGISCHTSERSKLRHRYVKKKALHQRKSIPGIMLRLIYVFKFVPPYSRKYSRKRLVRSVPHLIGCGHFLLKRHKSPHAEQVSHAGSTKKGGTSESTKNTEPHGRETTGLKNISPKIPPQPEPSFMASTYQRKAPCSPLIKTTWKDKESCKDPVIQAQKMDPAASCVPNSGKTADLHVAKHETPLEASIPEPLWKVVSSPHMDLGKKMETWEDLQSTENSYLPLSNGEGLATSTSERQRCFRKGNTQEQKDFLELVLESSDVSLLVSPGTKKHKSSEQSAGITIQESTEDVSEKEKKPLMLSVTGCVDRREGEELERDTRSNIKNMQDKRIPNAFHDATHTAFSEPPHVEVHSRFKTKADSSEIGLSHSVVKQDELRDDKMIQSVEYVEKGYIFEKPQEHDKEEEQALQEAVLQLAHGFRSSLQPTQKPKYVNFEIGQSSSESRRSHNQELEVQPQTLSTETIVGTRPSSTMAPCQVEKLQPSADRPTDGETAEPAHPLPVSASLPVLTETAERGVPFGRSPRKTLDEQIAEEKEDLKRVLPEVALESFHRHMLPLSGFKRKRIRNKLSGTISLLGPESVIMKAKKPPILRRRRLKGSFKILMKQRLQDQIVAERLVNVIEPRLSVLPHVRTQSRLNADDHGLSKPKQEKAEVNREECSDTINKGSDSGNAPKEAKLQHEMEGDEKASPEAFLQDSWNLRLDAYPEKELKTKKEMQQPSTVAEVMVEPIRYTIVDPFHIANVKTSLTTQTGTRCTTDSEMPPSASEKSLARDPLNQTRGRDVPDYGSDTREMGYCFPETKAELAAIFQETLNCHMPALSHFKKKKNRVRFSFLGCTVKPKSVHMKETKPSLSRMCDISRHRKKLESSFKAKFKKINQANGLVYEYLNTLYCPLQNRLQGESDSCYDEVQLHGLTDVGRPRYVDFFDRSSEFCGREENLQDGDKEEQKPLLRTAAQPSQYLWIDACQGRETHFTKPVSTPDHLTQEPPIHEQDRQRQTCFPQMALQAGLQMCPRETKELLKTSRLEDGIIAPMGLEILPPETGNTSLEKPLNTTPERGLPSGGNLEREPEAYLVGKNSELAPNLQVTFLQSSDSAEPLVSKSKRKKITLKLARKQKTMSCRHRTMREQKPSSILHVLNGLQNKELQCNLKAKMKSLQQNESTAAAFLDIIHFKVPRLNVEREMLRITRPSHMQLMQEKSPNGREVCRPDSLDTSSLCNHVKDEKEEPGEQEDFPAPENSQGFIFNVYPKKDHAFVKSDEEPEEAGSIDMQAQPPTHCTQTLLGSAPCPALAQFQFGKLDNSARFSPPMSGEANFDEKVFSARECGVPSGVNHQEERASDTEKKERVTLDLCSAALSVSKSKRNFKHHANMKIFMNPKRGILKAKKPSISYMLNIKGGAGPNHRKELGCDWTTKMKGEDQGEKMEDGMYSLRNFVPDAHRYSKREREMDMLGEKRLSSKQAKQEISPEEGTVTSDDTEETNLEDEDEEEREQEMLLNVIPQHSQHFIFCSGQAEELTLHTFKNKGSGKILFVIEQDIPPQTQPADPVQAGEPKRSHQSQTGTTRTASSDFPLLTSKESRMGRVSMDTVRPSVPRRGSHTGELYRSRQSHEGKAAVPKDLQATVLESLDVSAPDLSGSKRQRKTFTCRAFKSKMSPRGVAMKARKAPTSQIFNIPGNSCLKTLPPKTRKSQIVYFLIHAKYSGVLDNLTLERKEGLTHESPAWVIPTLVLPVSKRKKKDLKLTDKRNRMSHTRTPWKAKKAPISQMSDVPKRGVPRHSRQIEHHFKTMMKRGQPVADTIPNAIASPASGNVETGMPWKTAFSRELPQQEQSSGGERTWCDGSTGEEGRASSLGKEIRGHSGEAGPRNSQQFTVHAHKMKEPRLVKSDLERKYSAKGKPPESLTIAQELQQYALFTRGVAPSASGSTLNSPPLEKLPKRTKTQKGLQDAGSASVLSPVAEKSLRGSFIAVAQSDVPSGRGPGKKLSSAVPEGRIRLGEDLQARPLPSFGFSMPASSEIKGLRSAAQTPKSKAGQAQMAVIFKTMSTTRSGAPPPGQKQIYVLGDTAKGLSQSMPGTFVNTLFPPTPGPPALRTHKKLKAKKCPLRKKSSIIELKRNEGKKLCTRSSSKWSTSRDTSESRRQNEKEGNEVRIKAQLKFLPRTGSRKDQTMLVTEEQVQPHTLVSENILQSPCAFLRIPFPTEKLRIIPPQTEVLPRLSGKISCPKRGKAMSDGLVVAKAEHSPTSDGAPARKLDVPGAGSLKREEKEENIDTQKVIKYPRSEISLLEDPDDESSSRNVDGHFAKKHKELQRDLLALSMTSFLSESERQEKAFKFPERKDLKGAKCRTMKAKKLLCSQVLHSTKHGNLCCRNGQEGKLKLMIKDVQHSKSMTEAFSSPTPVSTDNKLDVETDGTPKPRMDPPRGKMHSHTSPQLEKPPCDGGAWEADLMDTQSRSSNTGNTHVPCEKEEKNTPDTLAESVPQSSQCFHFSSHHMKNLDPCKSESKMHSSGARGTWNLSCAMQKKRQEKHVRETILEPLSRNVMNFIQVQTLKTSLHNQGGIQYMVDPKTPLPKAQKSETGSIQCDDPWDGKPGRKRESPISKEKARNQNDFVRKAKILIPKADKSLIEMCYLNVRECSGSLQPREDTAPRGQKKQQEPCVPGTSQDSAYAYALKYPKIIKHSAKAETASMKNTTYTEQVKSKAKKPPVSLTCNTIGYGSQSNKEDTRRYIQKQKGFRQAQAEAELVLNTICDCGLIPSKIRELMERKREKGKPPKLVHSPPPPTLEKSLSQRQMAFSQSMRKSAISRNSKTLRRYVGEQKENQVASADLLPQCRYRFVISQQLKKETDHVKFTVDLKREVHPDVLSQKRETSCAMSDISNIRMHTKHEFLTAQRAKKGDEAIVQGSVSAPKGREVSEKTDMSLSSEGQTMLIPELAASQLKICKKQELLKQRSISYLEPSTFPLAETPHSENTGNVPEEDAYTERKSVSHLLRREGLKETDILQGSKGQTFLCTNVEVQQNVSAAQKDSVSCPSGEPLLVKQTVDATRKKNVSIPFVSNANPWRKEKSKLMDILSKSNEQKINLLQKVRAKQQRSSNQKAESILKSISSCILHQLHIETLQEEGSAKGMSSTVLSPVVEEASSKADNPVDQPPCSEGVNLPIGGRRGHPQESMCQALPTPVSDSLTATLQIKLTRVKKAVKEVGDLTYHTPNTEGLGLPVAGKEGGQPECAQHICPNLTSHSSRTVFQSNTPYEKKALEKGVSTVAYTPSAEGIGSPVTRQGEQQEKCTFEALLKSAFHSQACLLPVTTPVQQEKLDDLRMMHFEYSTPQTKEALKGKDLIVGYRQKSEKRQSLPSIEHKQQHLWIPSEYLLEHTSYPQNDSWPPSHLTPPTKEALSEMGNVSSETRGLLKQDLISEDQLNTRCQYGLEWTVPLIPPRQRKNQNLRLPLESFRISTVKNQNVSVLKGKKSSGGEQVIDSMSNGISPKLRVRKKMQLWKAYQKRVQKQVYLSGLFLHSLPIYMPLWPGSKRRKNKVEQGVKKGITCPQRTLMLEKSVFSNIFDTADYSTPGNRPEHQWNIKEKMAYVEHRKVKPDLVVTNIYEFIPCLPHLKLNKKTIDERFSNSVKRTKQPISQKNDRLKGINMKGRMEPSIILKAEQSSLSPIPSEMELPILLNVKKQEIKVQKGEGKAGMKLTNVPSLAHSNLSSRIKLAKDESGIPRSCLPPLKAQASSNLRRASFAESINRESLSNVIDSEHLPQKKEEDGDNIVYMKALRGHKSATLKRKKNLFKHTPHGKEPQWKNKEQEKMMQEDKSDLDVVRNKPHVCIPSSPHLEQRGPGLREEAGVQKITGFCLPPRTLQEVSDAMTVCQEPTDAILHSIKRAKYRLWKNEDEMARALEERRPPQRIALGANQSPVTQALQLNIKEKEEKVQEDKDERVGIQRKSRDSTSSPPSSEVDPRRKREAVMLRSTRSPFLHPEPQEPSDLGKVARQKSVDGVEKAKEHITQEEEKRGKMAKVMPLRRKKSPDSQEIQLDIKENKEKTQRMKGEPNVVLTCTSIPATSVKLDKSIKKADYRADTTRCSLPELLHQKLPAVVKKANKESTEGVITSAVQEAEKHVPQKGEGRGKAVNTNSFIHPKGTPSKAKISLHPREPSTPGTRDPQVREVQTNGRKNLAEVQERKVLTAPCLRQFPVNKDTEGKQEGQGIIRLHLPPFWPRESSHAEKFTHPVSPVNHISRDSRGTKYGRQKEEDKANVFMEDLMHPKCLALKAKKSPLFQILKAKKLQVSIREQMKRGQEGSKDTVVLLSKICPFATSSTHLKFDTIKEEEGEPGILRNLVPPPEPQDPLLSVQTAPPKWTDSHRKKGERYPPWKEKDGVQTAALSVSLCPSGRDFKAKTPTPPGVLSDAEHGALSRRKEAESCTEGRGGQGLGRAGGPDVAPTKTPPSSPSPSHRKWDAGAKGDKDLLITAAPSPSPFQLPESSGARSIRCTDSNHGISSCNVIIHANRLVPYKEAMVGVKTKDGNDGLYSRTVTLEAHTSPLSHPHSRKRLPLDVREQGKGAQKGRGEPKAAPREPCASLPPSSHLKWDPSRRGKEDTGGITRSCFPPLKIHDPFTPSTKADPKSCDGFRLKEERLKTATEKKMPPVPVHQKTKEFPLSYLLDTKELRGGIREPKKKVQREDGELVAKLKNICTSLLTLQYCQPDSPGERYMIRMTKVPLAQEQSKQSSPAVKTEDAKTPDGELASEVEQSKGHILQRGETDRERNVDTRSRPDPHYLDLKAKESPILLTQNLRDLQQKTKEQEGKVQEGKWELTETCTSASFPPRPNEKPSVREEGTQTFPPVNAQKSLGSEEEVHADPTASHTVSSPQKETRLPPSEEEGGTERRNFKSSKRAENEKQESKDEPGRVLTRWAPSSLSPLPFQSDEEVQVGGDVPAVHERSVLPRRSNAAEIACTESVWGNITRAVQTQTTSSSLSPFTFKSDKEVQVGDDMPAMHERPVLPRLSTAVGHAESVSSDVVRHVQTEKQPTPGKAERDRASAADPRRATQTKDRTLGPRKPAPSHTLHRTELYLHVRWGGPKAPEGPGKPPCLAVRKIYVSQPPAKPKLDKGTQVDEGRLGIKRPSLLPRMLSALSERKERGGTKGIGGNVIERKQHVSEKEEKDAVTRVDLRLKTYRREAPASLISNVLRTREFVLNVIKEPEEKRHKGPAGPGVVLTRTFLSIPSPPLYLDSGSKTDKEASGIRRYSCAQRNLQASADTRKTATRETAAGKGETVHTEPSVPEEVRQWTSNFMISVQRRKDPPRVRSEGDLSRFLFNSQQEDFHFTGFGAIRSEKRLECFLTGPEDPQEKYKAEALTTFLSFPIMDLTKIENLKKETEIMTNLTQKISPPVLVSLPRKTPKDIHAPLGPPVSAEGCPAAEQGAHQRDTLSRASPGSEGACKFDRPEGGRQNNEKISTMSPPNVLDPQTKESLEEMNTARSNASPNTEQEIFLKKQVVLQSGSGQKTRLDSSLSLKIPLPNRKQRTPLEIDMHKQTTVYPGLQTLRGADMGVTEFNALNGKKEQAPIVPEQEARNLDLLQKSFSSCFTFPLQSGDLEEKTKMDTSPPIHFKRNKLEMKEGILKINTNIAVHLEEDKIEMRKQTIVNLEKDKIKMDTSNTINLRTVSPKAEEPAVKTQVFTHVRNSCPIKQKHKKEREVSGAKQNIQLQKMFQKHILGSFYAYIPLPSKFGDQKGRLTVADLKRELSSKHVNMNIPKHPILHILGNTGHSTPSNRRKLEYNFNKPKTASWSEGASEIFIRSLSISMSPSQPKGTVKSETIQEQAKRTCLSKFQEKSPNTRETVERDNSSTVRKGNQNFISTVPRDSQPFVTDGQQTHKLPSVKSEANLSSESNRNLTPQTKGRVASEHAISRAVKEPDLLMTEQEKAPKPIQTPTECASMSEDSKKNVDTHTGNTLSMNISPPGVEAPQRETQLSDTVKCDLSPEHRHDGEPLQDTTTREVQQQQTSPGTVSVPTQLKSNEIKIVIDSPSAESLRPLYEAVQNVFESQVKNMLWDKTFADPLEEGEDNKPGDGKSPAFAGGPAATSMTVHLQLQPKPILENLTCKGKNKLTSHLASKAPEINQNLIPEMVKRSFQEFNCYPHQAISKYNSWRLNPKHKNMCFLSLEGIDTIDFNLKHKYTKDSPPASHMKSLTVNVSSGSEDIITKSKTINELERKTSPLTSAREMSLPHILQNYSVEEKNKLLIHFSMKTLEIQMKAFPQIMRESYTLANAQDGQQPLSKCIHSDVKIPRQKKGTVLLFEEKSLHQLDLHLRYKYLRFLLGLPAQSMFPKPEALPKHILKLQTVALCKKVDDGGESGGLSIDAEPLEQHSSFKKQSLRENSSLIRTCLGPTQEGTSDPDQHSMAQKRDTTALPKLTSHVAPEKEKQCHVWFQDTHTCESVDLKTKEKDHDLADARSVQSLEDFTDSQTNNVSSDNLEGCSALRARESEECLFLDANSYLSQESQNILLELQEGLPLEFLYKKKKVNTDSQPFYRDDSGSHHVKGRQKLSSVVTPPSYESHKSRKHRSSSKMRHRPPDSRCDSSLNTIDNPSGSSAIPFSEENLSPSTRSRKSYSVVPLTEANIKLHLAKSQGRPHRHLESKEGRQAKLDLFRKDKSPWENDHSYTQSTEKRTRKKKGRDYESERSACVSSKRKSASKPPQEDIDFYSETKQNQPFFYACVPADSLEITPQTVRWTVPPKTLRKRNFRVPLVAKISSSCSIWSSSKKLLGSLLESFSLVHQQ